MVGHILYDLYLTPSSHFSIRDFKLQLQSVHFGVLESLLQRVFILKFYKFYNKGHPGMTKMILLAHLHIWWPSIDNYIEKLVIFCRSCSQNARDPVRVPLHQWEVPAQPWQGLYMDIAGPYKDKMWLLVIDVYSKWPKICCLESATAEATIKHLRQILPHMVCCIKLFPTMVHNLLQLL